MEAGDNVLKAWEIKTKIDQWGLHQTENMLHEGNNQFNIDGACGRKQYLKAVSDMRLISKIDEELQ